MRPTARERADFDRDGAVLVKGVVPAAWLSVLAIERDRARYCGAGAVLHRLPAGGGPLPR